MGTYFTIRNSETGGYFQQATRYDIKEGGRKVTPILSIDQAVRKYTKEEAIYTLIDRWKDFSQTGERFEIVEYEYKNFLQGSKAKIKTVHQLDTSRVLKFAQIMKAYTTQGIDPGSSLGGKPIVGKGISNYYLKNIFKYLWNKKNGDKTQYVVLIKGEKVQAKDFPFKRGSFYAMTPTYEGRYIFLLGADQLMLVRLTYNDYIIYEVKKEAE